MNREETQLILIAGGVLLAFSFGNKILEFLNISDTKEEKDTKAAALINSTSISSAFSPNYYKDMQKKGKLTLMINFESAKQAAEKIRNAVSGIYWYDDDEEAVYSVFRSLKAKTDVSRLSEVYTQMTGKDLFGWLKSQLDLEELNTINKIVAGLPASR